MMGFNSNHKFNHYWVAILLVIYNLDISTVLAATNVTIDDQNPSITYSPPGAWSQSAQSSLDSGGAHMLTQNPNAIASFNFTGIAIYFLAPMWPYTVNTAVSLDSGPITLIDLVDHSRPNATQGPETVQSQVVWSATGLTNTQHNLRVSVGAGQPYAVVDGLIYTSDGAGVPSSSSSSSTSSSTSSPSSSLPPTSTLHDPVIASSTATPTSTSSAISKSQRVVAVALGSVFGALALIIILWTLWYCFRRRKRPISEAWTLGSTPYAPTMSGNPSTSGDVPNATNKNENWTADQLYNNGYYLTKSNDSHYENVGFPAPFIPSQPYYYGEYQNGISSRSAMHQPQMGNRIPNRYEPGYALSTITERSTPQMGEGRTPLANSPASYQTEMDYYTAPGSEYYTAQGSEASYPLSRQPPSSLGSTQRAPSPNTYPSPRRKPIEPKQPGNWI